MTEESETREQLPVYRVQARNTATESENKIHDDAVAAQFGFRGGLVPGVTVYGYMTVPLVERFSLDWLERGAMKVRFQQPFYDGDNVIVRAGIKPGLDPVQLDITAEREGGPICAAAVAVLLDGPIVDHSLSVLDYPVQPLPPSDRRLPAEASHLQPGTWLGTLSVRADLRDHQAELLERVGETLPIYFGEDAVAHPMILLGLANQILVDNVKLRPWIHSESMISNRGVVRDGEEISVRGRITECFERKGNEFVVLDVIMACGERIINRVRHTAIYGPRKRGV